MAVIAWIVLILILFDLLIVGAQLAFNAGPGKQLEGGALSLSRVLSILFFVGMLLVTLEVLS